MEVNQLVAHYKANYERKVFMTRLSHAMQNAYLMYIYDYPSELKNFADTFLAYLPFYIRNSDYFETVDENEDIDTQLITRSKNMRKNSKIIPHRQIASDANIAKKIKLTHILCAMSTETKSFPPSNCAFKSVKKDLNIVLSGSWIALPFSTIN